MTVALQLLRIARARLHIDALITIYTNTELLPDLGANLIGLN